MILDPQSGVLVIGAGAAGLVAARDLAHAGRSVTILEARDRCGGRILTLPTEDFGYPAEGGAEFIHGEAPVTRELMREAGLALQTIPTERWTAEGGALARDNRNDPHTPALHRALSDLTSDMPVLKFLDRHFHALEYARLRRSILRTVEGYDAADPARASTFALRDEWMSEGTGDNARIVGGYGALVDRLAQDCRTAGVAIRLNTRVLAIDNASTGVTVRCADGTAVAGEAAIVTVPLPLLTGLALPSAMQDPVARATADIGFGNVIKILFRFRTPWWSARHPELAGLSFLRTATRVPVWWTQKPAAHPVLTGWIGGPNTDRFAAASDADRVEAGLQSLAEAFRLTVDAIRSDLISARALDWARDSLARGAYSYATPRTRAAQSALRSAGDGRVLISGEALYDGRDQGTVEAALVSGRAAAQSLIRPDFRRPKPDDGTGTG